MADQPEEKSSYTVPVLLLIVAIIAGGIVKFYAPLLTFRPSPGEKKAASTLGEENVLARMWQDPFQAVENYLRYTKNQGKVPKDFTPELDLEIKNILILPVMTTAELYTENLEVRLRSRYAVLSALHVAGYRPKDAEHIGYFEREICGLIRTIPYEWFLPDLFPTNPYLWSPQMKKEYDAILVLWLGEEYFSDKWIEELRSLFRHVQDCIDEFKSPRQESQRRQTIEVLGPTNSTVLEEIISKAIPDDSSVKEFLRKMCKYFKSKEVLDDIEKNVSKKKQITQSQKEFEDAKSAYEMAKNNLKNERQRPVPDHVEFKIYSPWATADPLLMMAKKPISIPVLIKMYYEVQPFLKDTDLFDAILRETKVSLQRSIHPDQQLTRELVEELGRRDRNIGSKTSGDIVLISDWDTFYGRTLPVSFIISFLEKYGGKHNQTSNTGNNIALLEKIHIFSYMRGIDGMISNAADDSNSPPRTSTDSAQKMKKNSDASYFTPAFEQPLGQDQFDYIRRLTERIQQEYSKYNVCAIGVLGNDIYDKLLILRALHDQFPNAIFFTTDLDARLYHHTELPWTRNLVVASSYGLQLHPQYQWATPPFRSTYQTSLFFAALQALGIIAEDEFDFNGNRNQPRIFEIGHRGAYDLTPVAKGKSNSSGTKLLHPNRNDCWKGKPLKDWLFYLFFMLFLPTSVFSGLVYYNLQKVKKAGIDDPWKKYWMGFLISCITSFIALTVYAFKSSLSGEGEPITFFDGISIWPTELLRLFGGFLALYFLLFSIQGIVCNNKEITQSLQKPENGTDMSKRKGDTISNILEVWNRFQASEISKKKWIFSIGGAAMYLGMGYVFILTCGKPSIPYRGGISFIVDKCILISSLLFMLVLIMFVIYTTGLCIKFINRIIDLNEKVNWSKVMNIHCSLENDMCKKNNKKCKYLYDTCLHKYDNQMMHDTWGYWFKMNIIWKRTKVVGEMIKYPFLILFLLLVSRHKYFDNWTWTVPLAIVIGLTTLIALTCTIILFHVTKKARQQTITQLREEQLKLLNTQLPEEVDAFDVKKSKLIEQRSRSIEHVMNEIQKLKNGAFSPPISFQNPILMAILTPLGGMGSISLFQQIARFLKE